MKNVQKEVIETSYRNVRKNCINNEVFTLDEACEYLSISKSSLYKMNMEKVIPFNKPSRKVYYKKSDLDNFLNSNRMDNAPVSKEEIMSYFKRS